MLYSVVFFLSVIAFFAALTGIGYAGEDDMYKAFGGKVIDPRAAPLSMGSQDYRIPTDDHPIVLLPEELPPPESRQINRLPDPPTHLLEDLPEPVQARRVDEDSPRVIRAARPRHADEADNADNPTHDLAQPDLTKDKVVVDDRKGQLPEVEEDSRERRGRGRSGQGNAQRLRVDPEGGDYLPQQPAPDADIPHGRVRHRPDADNGNEAQVPLGPPGSRPRVVIEPPEAVPPPDLPQLADEDEEDGPTHSEDTPSSTDDAPDDFPIDGHRPAVRGKDLSDDSSPDLLKDSPDDVFLNDEHLGHSHHEDSNIWKEGDDPEHLQEELKEAGGAKQRPKGGFKMQIIPVQDTAVVASDEVETDDSADEGSHGSDLELDTVEEDFEAENGDNTIDEQELEERTGLHIVDDGDEADEVKPLQRREGKPKVANKKNAGKRRLADNAGSV